jgi:hypothetical protein
VLANGAIVDLEVRHAEPADYTLVTATGRLALNGLLGAWLELTFDDGIVCGHCGMASAKSYGGGFCWRCFTTLARCDLCVVSPARCHYAAGTCREPEWGERFCMQWHTVYLANSSGPKVGITRRGGEIGRWLDQGAIQGLAIAAAPTRHLAGVLEASLAAWLADTTDWRRLTGRDAPLADLAALRDRLVTDAALPAGVQWITDADEVRLHYPVREYGRQRQWRPRPDERLFAGRLIGIKGQYLLFDEGVFNVRRHRGYSIRMRLLDGPPERSPQLALF